MQGLLNEYLVTVRNMTKRKEELEKLLYKVRGEKYLETEKRYRAICYEIVEMEMKIKHMVRSMEKGVRF